MDYYAFGGTLSSYVNGATVDKYKFTGKERDAESVLDYFGARYYDSMIGRWLSVDPLADKYPGWSPYNYCENNPLILTDPDGKGPFPFLLTLLMGSKMKEPGSAKQNNGQQSAKGNHKYNINASVGAGATLFIFGGPHIEVNIGFSYNPSKPRESKAFANGQVSLLFGVGVGATAGVQGGGGISKPMPEGVSTGLRAHTEGNVGVGGTVGGSADVGLNQQTYAPESINGAISGKGGVGVAGYVGAGPAYNVNVGVNPFPLFKLIRPIPIW